MAKLRHLLASCLSLVVALIIAFYPEKRVLTWFEFLTDGRMPPVFANIAQDVLGEMWLHGFKMGVAQKNGEVTAAMKAYLNASACNSLVELAGGGGVAPTMWASQIREDVKDVTLLLTDLQPNTRKWERLRASHGSFVNYVSSSVDATSVQASIATHMDSDICALRMIHLALHHFPPELAHSMLTDVIRSHSAILVGDLAPGVSGVLWNWLHIPKHMLTLVRPSSMTEYLQDLPLWAPVLLPFLPFITWHDATVSVLRSYSAEELRGMVESISGGNEYEAMVFHSASHGDWLGVPKLLQRVLALDGPVMQYFLLVPHVKAKG